MKTTILVIDDDPSEVKIDISGSPCAEDFIEKPVDPNFLVESVKKIVRKQK